MPVRGDPSPQWKTLARLRVNQRKPLADPGLTDGASSAFACSAI